LADKFLFIIFHYVPFPLSPNLFVSFTFGETFVQAESTYLLFTH